MSQPTCMIYGANGFTGTLCAERAHEDGLRPILAGRNAETIRPLARRLGLESRIFALDDRGAMIAAMQDIDAVLHCAGPFSETSAPMLSACLATGTHYLDITGEWRVFEATLAAGSAARQAGVAAISGVGVDVIPTDCLAAMLHEAVPNAVRLDLALSGLGQVSPGTMKTVVEGAADGALARIDGVIRSVKPGSETVLAPFATGPKRVYNAPLGDIVTAYHTTGIPTIWTFFAVPDAWSGAYRWSRVAGQLTRPSWVRAAAGQLIERFVRGPDEQARHESSTEVWGRVVDADGDGVQATLSIPEGYAFTAQAAMEALRRVLKGDVPSGAHTPAQGLGSAFILELEGVTFHGFRALE